MMPLYSWHNPHHLASRSISLSQKQQTRWEWRVCISNLSFYALRLSWGSDIQLIQNIYKSDTFPGKNPRRRNLTFDNFRAAPTFAICQVYLRKICIRIPMMKIKIAARKKNVTPRKPHAIASAISHSRKVAQHLPKIL